MIKDFVSGEGGSALQTTKTSQQSFRAILITATKNYLLENGGQELKLLLLSRNKCADTWKLSLNKGLQLVRKEDRGIEIYVYICIYIFIFLCLYMQTHEHMEVEMHIDIKMDVDM